MGQSSSRGASSPPERRRSSQPSPTPRRISRALDGPSSPEPQPTSRSSAHTFLSFSRFRSDRSSDAGSSASSQAVFRRRSRLSRAHTSISSILSRPRSSSRSRDRPPRTNPHRFSSPFWPPTQVSSSSPEPPSSPSPRLHIPELDPLNFDDITTEPVETESLLAGPTTQTRDQDAETDRQTGLQRPNNILDRVAGSVVPERSGRSVRNSLRRRRSPLNQGEDNAAMLSRLLSVAAAATAATLMGEDHRAGAEARNFVGGDEDGTFDGFLQSLQNGRIASALRGHTAGLDVDADEPGPPAPLNFFRMFRFGSSTGPRRDNAAPMSSGSQDGSDDTSSGPRADEDGSESRMVPIIIVGIRSINPNTTGAAQHDDNIPPFLDALSSFPTPVASGSEPSIDGILRQPQNGTRFSHRRRASMGGINTFPSAYDNQRHQRTSPSERPRPFSTLSDTTVSPRPPPSTPSGLSAFSSGATTPTFSPPSDISALPSTDSSRRGSFVRSPMRATSSLESPTEEPRSLHQLRTARQRRLSESDHTRFGAGSARRNGVVEPDHAPGEGPRSWIIYVLGGSYPENHPILTTPSLFTDTPTYEDMMLLSTLLGPAKPPVASESDVTSAGGLYMVQEGSQIDGEFGNLVAAAVEGNEMIAIPSDQRCLVCLSEYQRDEEARKLIKCGHLFHRECIDQVSEIIQVHGGSTLTS
ncbi:hypothetical protein B0J12DRAFT_658658 [Macrophomina phaseolina]|uniref:RING-type domain-containing protein n=1 Tax=Macrophomina phaseolina TaxID=35725 RepID=A0ABQ8GDR1_9PEZI|nr:hypothetical protein B0J12DRAFT_658658 [Macrophomina phaseolina]